MAIPDLLNSRATPVGVSLGVFGLLLGVTVMAGIALTNLKVSAADSSASDSVTIQVKSSCTMSGGDSTYNANVNPGQETSDLGPSNIQVVCNDAGGFAIYAIGFSGNKYTGENHTKLIGTTSTIPTGTSGDNSWWAFKVNPVTGTYQPSIAGSYSSYSVVPDTFAKVAYREASTDAGAGATGSGLQAYYKVKASLSQAPEDYTGRVKYTLVHPNGAPAPEIPTAIQDLTAAQCQTQATDAPLTVYDRRDGSEYTVRYINGNCWMTQNLRITGTISAADSNFTGDDFNVSAYDLKTNGNSECNYTNSRNNSCNHIPDATDLSQIGGGITAKSVGAWYNYVAVSAGTITGSSSSTTVTSDICPSGWHLPTGPSTTANTDFNKLVGTTSYGWSSPTAGFIAFDGAPGGYYYIGSISEPGLGFWWTANATGNNSRSMLLYRDADGYFSGSTGYDRAIGGYVRCVRST